MGRFAVVFAVGAAVLAFAVPPAAASGATSLSRLNQEVSGPFSGTTTFDFNTAGCTFVHQTFDAIYSSEAQHHHGALHIDGCVEGLANFPINGTFTLGAPGGAKLNGTVTGTLPTAKTGACPKGADEAALDFTLTVATGTRQFADMTGTISLKGTWCSPAVPSTPGPITGKLTAHLVPPK
jgi:hypothetical protein